MDVAKINMKAQDQQELEGYDNHIISLWRYLREIGVNTMDQRFLYILNLYSSKKFNVSLVRTLGTTEAINIDTDEWKLNGFDTSDQETFCISSDKLNNTKGSKAFYLKSKLNGNVLRVGLNCVTKFFSDDHPINRDLKIMGVNKHNLSFSATAEKDHQKKEVDLNIKICRICRKKVLNNREKICSTCYDKSNPKLSDIPSRKPLRRCLHCSTVMIDDAAWKKFCRDCHLKK